MGVEGHEKSSLFLCEDPDIRLIGSCVKRTIFNNAPPRREIRTYKR